MTKVSFIKSDNRSYNVERSLALIKTEITSGLRGMKRVVIKPSCIVENRQLASTHVDAIEAVLKFIRPYVKGQITLAEGTEVGNTLNAFKKYSYLDLQDQYDLALVDLNNDEFESIELVDKNGGAIESRIAKTLIDADYIISISPPKTDKIVAYSGAIKSTVSMSLVKQSSSLSRFNFFNSKSNKVSFDADSKTMSENICRIYDKLALKLAVIDGFEVMEGNGPIDGEMVPAHFAIASTNPVAADWLAIQCLAVDMSDVEYLTFLGAMKNNNYFVAGDDWQKEIVEIKTHPDFHRK